MRGIPESEDAISPPRFPDWTEPAQIRDFADEVRDRTGGLPIGYKLSAQLIEKDIDAALEASVELMQVIARACWRDHLSGFTQDVLTTWKRDMADLSGVAFGGVR